MTTVPDVAGGESPARLPAWARHPRPAAPPFPGAAAEALAADLRGRIAGEVRFDEGSRALYSTDSSNYRQVPIGVVIPRTVEDVIETVAAARRHGAPVLSRGAGTSLAGECCNVAVVMDMSKYLDRVLEIDPLRKLARVQPGVVLDNLRAAAEQRHLTYGPDPATHDRCTLGGMIGNNSCGAHSIMAGKTDENVAELDVLTYDGLRLRVGKTSDEELAHIIAAGGRRGEIYGRLRDLRDRYADLIRARFPHIPRRVSGFNLDQLLPENGFHVARALVGTEATCVTVLEATLNLVPSPPARVLVMLGYPDVASGCDHVTEIMDHHPIALEGFDGYLVDFMKKKRLNVDDIKLLPPGEGWLLVEFGADTMDEAAGRARGLMDALGHGKDAPAMKLFTDRRDQERMWTVRESGLAGAAIIPGVGYAWSGWEDSAVRPDQMGPYLRDFRRLMDDFGYQGAMYGHFGHGCLHIRINFDLETRQGIDKYLWFIDKAADLVVSYGGSLSGEHGDGQSRSALLSKMYGDELVEAFREFKAIWDPGDHMNPGKVIAPYLPDQNLRLGATYRPWRPETTFQFPDDEGSFTNALMRCVGVGKCRREGGGTMCPSYQVTHEEMHSTRGRARLLFEMMQGQVIGHDGWRDRSVKEALDLCLACKGCKGDCPIKVDMATYKAEFMSHYYAGRLRPRPAYAFGLIYWWARLASHVPGLANLFTQTPGLRAVVRLVTGMAPQRRIPPFARQTFKSWWKKRPALQTPAGKRVILWADTFNNYFLPETAQAAVDVLEAAGWDVYVPTQSLCCGRPLFDWGFLDQAKALLRQVLDTLAGEIRAGTPIVGLEPSCIAVFRDELVNLFPHDEDARRLSGQAYLLSEFLQKFVPDFEVPALKREAIVHGHCQHKAVMTLNDEHALLKKLGLDYKVAEPGCCGMAGAFGFEAGEHYEVSIKAGERALLPAVRAAPKDTLVIADGFSCREQIGQTTDRRALHLAQVLQMALREGPKGAPGPYPERQYVPEYRPDPAALVAVSGALAAVATATAFLLRRRKK